MCNENANVAVEKWMVFTMETLDGTVESSGWFAVNQEVLVKAMSRPANLSTCQENGYFHTHFCDHFFELFTYSFLSLFPAQ